jgi:hypothetical protein
MGALFLSIFRKQLRGLIALSFLLASLLGTHWIGLTHGITHSGIHYQNIELSCVDQAPTLGHDSVGCHLFDSLTLAGFVASIPTSFVAQTRFIILKPTANQLIPICVQAGLYQSRAPPSFIL